MLPKLFNRKLHTHPATKRQNEQNEQQCTGWLTPVNIYQVTNGEDLMKIKRRKN